MKRALFVSFEGVHGAGKTSTIEQVARVLRSRGLKVTWSKDQLGTPLSRRLRRINLDVKNKIDPVTETLLAAAARRQNFVDVIFPALMEADVVLTERFIDAFYAFGVARNLPLGFIDAIAGQSCNGVLPDLTLLLDLDPHDGLSRIEPDKRHRVERESMGFHRRLREAYVMRARMDKNRIHIIDASRSSTELVIASCLAVEKHLPNTRTTG